MVSARILSFLLHFFVGCLVYDSLETKFDRVDVLKGESTSTLVNLFGLAPTGEIRVSYTIENLVLLILICTLIHLSIIVTIEHQHISYSLFSDLNGKTVRLLVCDSYTTV